MANAPARKEAVKNTSTEETGEFYRVEFYNERAEIAVEMAKRLFARTLNGNHLIPMAAFDEDKEYKDKLGNAGHMTFKMKPSKLQNGYHIEMMKDGVPFDKIAKDPKALHIIEKNEVDHWDIQITVPGNLSRESLVAAFGQTFGKKLVKNNFKRTKGGTEEGVPLHNITINLGTLVNAPDLRLANTSDGQMLMVDAEQMALEAAAAKAARKLQALGHHRDNDEEQEQGGGRRGR